MKRTFHYSGTILWNSLPPINLKLIQDIDLFKKKYTDCLMSKQNKEWLYSLLPRIYPWLYSVRLWYFVVNMYVLFEIVFAVFDYYCFEGHRED